MPSRRVEPGARELHQRRPRTIKLLIVIIHHCELLLSFAEHPSFPLPVRSVGCKNQIIKTKAALDEECSQIDFIALLVIRELTEVVEAYYTSDYSSHE